MPTRKQSLCTAWEAVGRRIFAEKLGAMLCRLSLCLLGALCLFGQEPLLRLPSPDDSTRLYRSPTVVVTGTRNPTAGEYAPVRVKVLPLPQGAGAAYLTVADLLEESAGIVQQYRIRSGLQMMGLEPAYTLILLNGQPLTGRVAGVLDLRRLPLGSVERIEIVKGPTSSLYGSAALGGVVNILTPRPDQGWQGRLQARYTTRAGSDVHASLGYGNSRIAAQLLSSVRYSTPFQIAQDTAIFPYAGLTELALQSIAYWYPHPAWALQADARFFHSHTHGAFAESYGGQLAVNRGTFRQQEWSAAATAQWTYRRARLQWGLFGNAYAETYLWDVPLTPTGSSTDDFLQRLGRLWWQYDLLWNIRYRFTTGGELLWEDVSGTRYPDHPFMRTLALFGQWEGNPYPWLGYALSLRWDRTSAWGEHWSPKLAFLLRPWGSNSVQFRFSFGTGFRAPDFRQLFVSFTNRLQGAGYALLGARRLGLQLQPERSVAADVSVLIPLKPWLPAHGEDWTIEVRGFANWVRNLIEPFYVGRQEGLDIYSYHNLARIATRGVELTVAGTAYPAPQWQLSFRAGYQFLDAVDLDVLDAIAAGTAGWQDPTTGRFYPVRRSDYGGLWGRSRHTLSGSLRLRSLPSNTSVSLRLLWRSRFGDESLDRNGVAVLNPPRRILDRPEEYVPGFWNLDCWMTQSWKTSAAVLSLSAGVRNALNVLNPRFLPQLVGRQWFLSAELRWASTAQ